MESLINFQNDLCSRMSKAKLNFKKTPKERMTKLYIEGRLEAADQLWFEFLSGHKDLMRNYDPKELNASAYIMSDKYSDAEEIYMEYKCELKSKLSDFNVAESIKGGTVSNTRAAQAKLPKINIPNFSGIYSEWTSFKDLFKSLIIQNESLDSVQKLHYLKGHLTGEAEQLLRHIPVQESNFERCWQLLEERYNNKKYICHHVLKRLLSQKNISVESATALKDIVDTTNDCLATLTNLGIDVKSWDVLIIHILTLKLDPESRRQWEFNVTTNTSTDELPTYVQFKEFLTSRFRAIEFLGPDSRSGHKFQNNNNNNKVKALHVTTSTTCPFCSEDHKLSKCKTFHKETPESRRKFVYDNNVCFNCLGSNHSAKECRSNVRCSVCKRTHHSLLHPKGAKSSEVKKSECVAISSEGATTSSTNAATSSLMVSCVAAGKVQQQVLLATALVKAICKNGNDYSIRALLDQGSQASFVTESTVQYLGLKKIKSNGQITGLGGDKNIASKAMVTIEVRSRIDPEVKIPVRAHVLKNITSLLPTRRVEAREWQELGDLVLADPDYCTPNHIDLLLGAEVYGVILQDGVKKDPRGTLIAQATSLGWILSGAISCNIMPSSRINVMHCCADDDSLRKFWELEADIPQPKSLMFTEEEKRCEQIFAETTRKDSNGRYIVRLPFRNGIPEVTGSCEIAKRRLNSLENRLSKDKHLRGKYEEVLDEYLALDHMEAVPEKEIQNPNAIYLPHHAVVRNDKETTKVRIVFDASCSGKNNLSLNNQLLVGPTIQPELRHIVMQWRSPPICMSADIVKMYRQVKVDAEDADYQRILWRTSKDSELNHYRLTRVTFGTASAPYLSVKALQQVARDHGEEYPEAAERVLKHFYVDDLMTGVQNCDEGKRVFQEMNELLGKAGFELQKWNSNNDELVKEMNVKEYEEKDIQDALKINEDELIKIMGLTWNRSDDTFRYVVILQPLQEPVTKRKIISDISRLYDPLGWVGPSIIIAKVMIQKLWLAGLGWDEEVPDTLLQEWLTYREEQTMLCKIRIPRWVGTKADDVQVELHGFCDASKIAYAAAVYIRVIDCEGKVKVSLITAKTKVAPVKQVSIPRLELCGAVLVTRLVLEVAKVLNVEKHNIHTWTDSTVVLAWLNSHPSRWNVFVANRVSEILTHLDPQNWCHVTSKQNPADCASRGLRPSELVDNELWFCGPKFISCEHINYQKPKDVHTEIEAAKIHFAAIVNSVSGWDNFSSLTKTVRVIAYCRRFLNNSRAINPKLNKTYLTAKELKEALKMYIQQCQSSNFKIEMDIIKGKKSLPKSCKIQTLNPFLDEDGVLRVGGRLNFSSLSFDRKHPILIPKESHLTELIIADAHSRTLHGGPQITLTCIQSKYWIMGAKQLVKSHYHKCVTCAKNAGATKQPLMGQLPAARVTPTRPFKHSGVDYAGPIQVRTSKGRGHKSQKGYICLFICMATRAIHLELVSDLTTEGFLQAFKRFVARRGHCQHLWSDNGTNFTGASSELKKCSISEQKYMDEVAELLANNNCEWHFIPPHSPNFGGLWEAGVKSVKYHLKRVIGDSTLTFEEMATVLAQVEACLNSRPMSSVTDDSENFDVLTPGHFLIGEPLVTAPDHNYEALNVGTLRRWQHTQKMLQIFWRKWSQDYLIKFLHRYKWAVDNNSSPNIGDIVVVKEDNLPPCRWLYGRVIATHLGADNIARVVTLKTKNGTLKRPVSKLCFLPVAKD